MERDHREETAFEQPVEKPIQRVEGADKPQGLAQVLLAGSRGLAASLPHRLFEIDFDLSDKLMDLRKKIAWIIRVRFGVNPAVVLLMLITNWQGLTRGAPPLSRETLLSTALTAGVSIGLNALYIVLLRRGRLGQRGLERFVFLQLVLDVGTFAAYVWRTGGVTSPFSFLLLLPIIGACLLLGPGAGMAMAGISAAGYLLLVTLVSWGILPHVSYFVALDQFAQRSSYITLMTAVNLFALVAVAAATGFLVRQVHNKASELERSNRQLAHKAGLFRMLYEVTEVLQHNTGLDEVLDRICDVLVSDLDVDRALMYVVEGKHLRLRRVAYHSRISPAEHRPLRVEIPLDPAEGLTARAALLNQGFNVTDPASQEGINAELAQKIGLNPFAIAPMAYREHVLGVLGVDRSSQRGVIAPDEWEVLVVFARQAGQTLALAAADDQVGRARAERNWVEREPAIAAPPQQDTQNLPEDAPPDL